MATVRGAALPRSCVVADVIRTSATDATTGLADASRLFSALPGLTMVAVALPPDQIAFVTRERYLFTAARQPHLVEDVYLWWVTRPRVPLPRSVQLGQPFTDGLRLGRTE
ncbi:hypothetical protein GCM10017774_53260 [Lentzea cavernae]|uniref:LysR substrate binding domain-containing protein n=1 Tax=Lentzea cavernae TaxID=2020703 RepID=A0ABQ3MKP3_9PSEU|nr:hypothetical protein GCM10017774_53260 [Lentzea cavernae]